MTTYQKVRGTNHHHRKDQDTLAAELVADVAHEKGADRACDIADSERRQRQQRAHRRIGRGEKDPAENERRGGAIDEEVVVLQRAPNPAGERRLDGRFCSVWLVRSLGFVKAVSSSHVSLPPDAGSSAPVPPCAPARSPRRARHSRLRAARSRRKTAPRNSR